MFAAITPVLALGATAERGRVAPALVWTFLWSTIVYSPVAFWYWNPKGWVYIMGGLDFAGGGPVHMSSGSAALGTSSATRALPPPTAAAANADRSLTLSPSGPHRSLHALPREAPWLRDRHAQLPAELGHQRRRACPVLLTGAGTNDPPSLASLR